MLIWRQGLIHSAVSELNFQHNTVVIFSQYLLLSTGQCIFPLWWLEYCQKETFNIRNNMNVLFSYLICVSLSALSVLSNRHVWSPKIKSSQRRTRWMEGRKMSKRKRRMKAGWCSVTSMRSPTLSSKMQQSPSIDRTTRGWWDAPTNQRALCFQWDQTLFCHWYTHLFSPSCYSTCLCW